MGIILHRHFAYVVLIILLTAFLPSCSILYPTQQESYKQPEAGTYIVHRVKQGESIAIIAKLYDVSIDDIQRINRKDVLKVVDGDFVRIPQEPGKIKTIKKDTVKVKKPDAVSPILKDETIDFALLLPYYLDKNFGEDEYDVHQKTLPALNFYEGALLAKKQLAKDSIRINLKAFDTSKNEKVSALLNNKKVLENDILLGEFSNSVINDVLPIVKNNNQQLILRKAFRSNMLSYHPEVALAKPSSARQCELMAGYMQNKFSYADFYIVYQDVRREKDLAALFKRELDTVQLFAHYEMKGDMLMEDADDEIKNLFAMMDSTRQNVLFITSSNEPFVNSLLRRLYTKSAWDITIVGLPTWQKFNSMDTYILNEFNMHLFTTDYIDYDNVHINKFRKQFIKEYNADPLPDAYEGYFLVNYLTALYRIHGNNYMDYLQNRPDKRYSFKQVGESGGYENQYFSVLSFTDFKLIKVN